MANGSLVRATRLLYIRDLLMQRPQSIKDLARACDVSADTISRDLIAVQLEPMYLHLVVDRGTERWRIVEGPGDAPRACRRQSVPQPEVQQP